MAIQIESKPNEYGVTMTHVTGSRDELMKHARQHLRKASIDFYLKSIPRDLDRDGSALIDRHAIGDLTRMIEVAG